MAAKFPTDETVATGGSASSELSGKQIVDLSAAISSRNMELFAQKYLGIEKVTLDNMWRDSMGNSQKFTGEVINYWTNKNPDHQVKCLADLLYAAIDKHGLADPHMVEQILGVPQSRALQKQFLKTSGQKAPKKKEFQHLAKKLRPHTKKAMKIEVAPWIQDFVEDMDELYCELSLEKTKYKSLGVETQKLDCYQDAFETKQTVQGKQSVLQRIRSRFRKSESVEYKRNTVLIKADPGMGKTTLGKRIAYDWARGVFTKVSLVLFVFLKLVNPVDPIENAIINQNPVLEGMRVTADRLQAFLETFGSRCLLILDGMDEHASGSNSDIIKIIEGGKFLDCNIILTSRPHSTLKYEKEFDTIVRVDGFTESEARKFAIKLLQDETLVEKVLQFNPSGWGYEPLYRCPILLSFLCILINNEGAQALDKDIEKGEIYARMIACLYQKYTVRKGKGKFKEEDEFHEELREALKGVGKLAYQTLLSGDPSMKRSQVVSEVGEDVFDYGLLIGNEDHRRVGTKVVGPKAADIVITFPHRSLQEFLGSFYYIWMLSEGHSIGSLVGSGKEPFFMENPLFLEFCVWFLFNSEFEPFVLPGRDTALSAMSSYVAGRIDKEELDLDDIKVPGPGIADALKTGKKLMIQFYENVLEKCHNTKQLKISKIPCEIPPEWVKTCLKKEPSVDITSLRITGTTSGNLSTLFSHAWPGLEKLNLEECELKPEDLTSLARAKAEGKLPDLKVLDLCDNKQISGDLSTLFSHAWLGLEELGLNWCGLKPEDLTSLARAKAEGKFPDLKVLDLYGNKQISGDLSVLFSHPWPGLEKLGLRWCGLKPEDLTSLARAKSEGKLPDLKVLDLYGFW